MMRRTHQCAAFLLTGGSLVVAEAAGIETDALTKITMTGVSAWAALLPDIDTPSSYISRKIPFLYLPIWFFRLLVGSVSLIPGPQQKHIRSFYKDTGHRGFSHYPFTWVVFFTLLAVLCKSLPVPFWIGHAVLAGSVIGVASHIAGDVFFGGISLLYPFSKRRIKPTCFKTGGKFEDLVFFVLLVSDLFIGLKLFDVL